VILDNEDPSYSLLSHYLSHLVQALVRIHGHQLSSHNVAQLHPNRIPPFGHNLREVVPLRDNALGVTAGRGIIAKPWRPAFI